MMKITFAGLIVGLLTVLGAAQSPRIEIIVKGHVLDYEGRPVAGASVTAGPVGPLKGVMPMTKSNEQGEFSVAVHQTGQFFVSAQKSTDGYPSTSNRFYYPNAATTPVFITVLADQPTPSATVQFGPKAGKLSMLIADEDTGEPLRTVTISLCRTEAPKFCHRITSNAVRNVHSALVPSAPFTVEVEASGYESAYGENSPDSKFQVLQVPSDTTKKINISMRKGTANGLAQLPAPKIVSPVDRTVLLNVAHPRMLTLEWAAVPGAATYAIEVDVCEWEAPDGGECRKGTTSLAGWRNAPPTSGIEGTRYELVFPGTQPGRWRVWAVDELGQPGAKTPWTLFFYRWEK